jgi:hypothetical protein
MIPAAITWRRVAGVLGIVSFSGGLTLAALTVVGVTFRGEESGIVEGTAPETPVASASLNPLTTLYDFLTRPICVEVVATGTVVEVTPGALEELARTNVESALAAIAETNPIWEQSNSGTPPAVEAGCPSVPLRMNCDLSAEWPYCDPAAQDVTTPIGPSTVVFIMPPEQIEQLLMGLPSRVVEQEYICPSDLCIPTANALYLTPEEAQTASEAMTAGLEIARGVRPPRD